MDEKRELEILRAYVKSLFRKDISLNRIADVKRNIGNTVRESELMAIKVTKEEALDLASRYLSEIFESQMRIGGLRKTTYL